MNETENTTNVPTITELAQIAYDSFEVRTRHADDGEREAFTSSRDDAPEWVRNIVQESHGDMLPDDWRYVCIRSAFGAITDAREDADLDDLGHEFADRQVDIYTHAGIMWLASNLSRVAYCDEGREEFGEGQQGQSITDQIGMGQYMEATEVYGEVRRMLEDHAEELAEDGEGR